MIAPQIDAIAYASACPGATGHLRHAYFFVAKYRCDGRDLHTTTAIRVAPPSHGGQLTIGLHQGETGLDYCQRYPAEQPVDPGNRVLCVANRGDGQRPCGQRTWKGAVRFNGGDEARGS